MNERSTVVQLNVNKVKAAEQAYDWNVCNLAKDCQHSPNPTIRSTQKLVMKVSFFELVQSEALSSA